MTIETTEASVERTVAVLVPCFNEERTVARVVAEFRSVLPTATIYVYDNNSTDRTAAVAREAGATVRQEQRQGKGHVVRRMFSDIDADVYLLVDGDATYDAKAAEEMVRLILDRRLDLVNGARDASGEGAYRPAHRLGNLVLTGAVRTIFGRDFSDMLSGYKAFSRRFVLSFPAMSRGFEIETEFTIHALELQMPCAEIRTEYCSRPEGSFSKLSTVKDGIQISMFIMRLFKDERPFAFFGFLGALAIAVALVLGTSVVLEFLETGLVPRVPTAILAASLVNLGSLLGITGLVLDLVTKARREVKRLSYLSIRG